MYGRPLLFIYVALAFGSCVPVYVASNAVAPHAMEELDIPTGASIRVVHGDPGNPVQLFVERALDDAGFAVYSNGLVSASVPVAEYRYESMDTTVYRTDRSTVYQRLYDDPPVDYLLKYAYSGDGATLTSFSASLVYADTGELLTSYADSYLIARSVDRVVDDFTESLRQALAR